MCIVGYGTASGPARAEVTGGRRDLQLDVVINGEPINEIGSFTLFPGGIIGATKEELESLGLRALAAQSKTEMVLLNQIPTLRYAYEERTQRIRITIDDAYRLPRVFDLHGDNGPLRRPKSGWGVVLDYDLFSTFSNLSHPQPFTLNDTSLTLEGRAFSPLGTFSQSGILGLAANQDPQVIRLDTDYRYSDVDRMITWTAGDAISGGLTWTRPIRLGGLQAQRSFSLRPDLVTMPLPNIGGTAEVPSTVDVYVNNVRTFSQDVGNGPFSLTNIPMVTGAGNAQVVVRDSSGHDTTISVPFYGSTALLAQGLSSWSLEAGLPRLSYGSVTDTYLDQPVGSASWRRGLLNWFTAEAHAEGGDQLANGGIGGAVRIGALGVATAAVAGSRFESASGGQGAGSFETQVLKMTINVSTQRTFSDYEDLASVTARQLAIAFVPANNALGEQIALPVASTPLLSQQIYANTHAPRVLDRITLGGPLPFDALSSWGLSFVHEQTGSVTSRLASVSYSRPLPFDASLFVTGYRDFAATGSTGVLLGLSIPLGGSASISSNLSAQPEGAVGTLQASQPLGPTAGSVGWQVQDSEGAIQFRQAQASYRAPALTVQGSITQSQAGIGGTLGASGAIAGMGGDFFFSDRIPDAFAVVDAGAPDVEVSYENRPVGYTDGHGMILVPTLRSYETNRISVDPTNLPVDTEIETTREIVTPADRAGILVPIRVHNDMTSAVVTFVRTDGSFVGPGSRGRLLGGGRFVVGYDGQSFIKDLTPSNQVDIDLGDATCHAAFTFAPRPGEQVRIGPVPCR